MIKTLSSFVVSCFFLHAVSAQAEIPTVTASSSAGTPGGHVVLELAYDYGSGFEVFLDEFRFQYDARVLNFVAGNSTVESGGTQASWSNFVGELATLAQANPGLFGINPADDAVSAPRQGYVLSFFTNGSVGQERSGIVRYRLWFDVDAGASVGPTNVTVSGVMYDLQEQEFLYPEAFATPGIAVSVVAVPEPAQVLLLLAGLGVVAARYRCRYARRALA